MVNDEDTSYIPTTYAREGFHVKLSQAACKRRGQANSPQMLRSYPSNSCPAMSSDLVKVYHVGRLGI